MRGAEAIVTPCAFFSTPCVSKKRLPKSYRTRKLDVKLRRERTKLEARILNRAKANGVLCPLVLAVDLAKCEIIQSRLKGVKLVDCLAASNKIYFNAGVQLARLHLAGISHGDATTSNFMVDGENVFIFDFGLSQFNASLEEQAIDLLLFSKSVSPEHFKHFLKGYEKERGSETKRLLTSVKEIQSRARYVER